MPFAKDKSFKQKCNKRILQIYNYKYECQISCFRR
nr:MAG TPA: hypothetical protein [Caudoviricetes sp.]